MAKAEKKKFDLYAHITQKFIDAIDAGQKGDKWEMPWHRMSGNMLAPMNGTTKKYYNGINVLMLLIAADEFGFTSNKWATSRQWKEAGRKLRDDVFNDENGKKRDRDKVERSMIVYFSMFDAKDRETGEPNGKKIPFLKYSTVYNECQLEDYEPPKVEKPKNPNGSVVNLPHIEKLIEDLDIKLKKRGDRAFYSLDGDYINMPAKSKFKATKNGGDATQNYYSTLLHEVVHWTGHEERMKRDMSGHFGSDTYAFEELVAEIGTALACAKYGVTPEFRPDHANYVKSWIKVLQNDKKYIFNAAKAAKKAVDYVDANAEVVAE